MNGIFIDKPSNIKRWLNAKGYPGSYPNALYNYFSYISGIRSGTIFDHIDKTLSLWGLSGTLQDKLTDFFIRNTGINERRTAERSFFNNDNKTFEIVMSRSSVAPAFAAMATERVAIIGLGDSNQNQGGHGWDYGVPYGLYNSGYTMFGTGLLSGVGLGGSLGYGFTPAFGMGGVNSGAPVELSTYLDKGSGDGMGFFGYSYLNDGESFSNNNNGMQVQFSGGQDPLNLAGNLRGHLWYGTFPSGTGQMRLKFRDETGVYSTIAQGSTINPVTGAYGLAETTLDLPAGTRPGTGQGISFGTYSTGTGVTLEGPSFITWVWVENTDRTSGFSYSTLDAQGGQSTREICKNIQALSDNTLDHYLTVIRSQLGANKKIIFWINEGLNDRNETLASLGPLALADGDSPEAYADNMQGIIERVRARYTANSWDFTEVYWVIMPSHPISTPDDSELVSYRETAGSILVSGNPRLCLVDLNRIVTYKQLLNGSGGGGGNSYYASSGTDTAHMVQPGYEFLGKRAVEALYRP